MPVDIIRISILTGHGAKLVPVQSYAAAGGGDNGDHKTTQDYKDGIHKDINAKSDKTNQHLDHDNICYQDDGCEQANEGEQAEGKNNEASGFNDQSKNAQQQQPAAGVSPPPSPREAEQLRHRHPNRHPSGHKESHLS